MAIAFKKFSLMMGCILLILACWAGPVSAAESRSDADLRREIDDYVRSSLRANPIPAAALAVSRNGETFYAQGYGTDGDGREITGSTPFPIASLSKSFTALAVLQLAEKGLVDLDAPYASYFPNLAPKDERVRKITVRNLLNQTSGLNDKANPDMTRSPQYRSLEEINQALDGVKLAHDPGTAYSYHNPNYQYLARLVEQVGGQSFADYLKDNVFEPLGMNHTFNVGTTRQIVDNPAIPRGHYVLWGRPVSREEPLWFIDGPAGIVSTAEDMARWMQAQYEGRLLGPELMEAYHQAGPIGPYGMGWIAEKDEREGRTISHSGILWTYKAEETIFLDRKLGIAMMFDSGLNAFVDYSAIVEGVAKIMRGEEAGIPLANGRNIETALIALTAATIGWGVYSILRLRRRRKRITTVRLVVSTVLRLLPALILPLLSPILSFVGGGRVVPWFGIWTLMASLIVWLAALALANLANLACRYRLYFQARR